MKNSTHASVGLSVFERKLREGLNKRIDLFVAEMKSVYMRHGENKIMTEREWVEEFQKWSEQKELQRIAEQYILSVDG